MALNPIRSANNHKDRSLKPGAGNYPTNQKIKTMTKRINVMKSAVMIGLFCLLSSFISHPFKTDFSGMWTINTGKTNFGEAPQWTMPLSLQIKQKKKGMDLQRTTTNAKSEIFNYTEVLSFDGKPANTTAPSGRNIKSMIKWPDESMMVLSSEVTTQDNKPWSKITEKYSLADNGKTLIVERTVDQGQNSIYTIKAYYDKKTIRPQQ
jgi:hypothetical protein